MWVSLGTLVLSTIPKLIYSSKWINVLYILLCSLVCCLFCSMFTKAIDLCLKYSSSFWEHTIIREKSQKVNKVQNLCIVTKNFGCQIYLYIHVPHTCITVKSYLSGIIDNWSVTTVQYVTTENRAKIQLFIKTRWTKIKTKWKQSTFLSLTWNIKFQYYLG